jgi:hypothetical protein
MIHGYSPNGIAFFSKSDLRGNGWKSSGCRNKVRCGRMDGQFRHVE